MWRGLLREFVLRPLVLLFKSRHFRKQVGNQFCGNEFRVGWLFRHGEETPSYSGQGLSRGESCMVSLENCPILGAVFLAKVY